jgi:curli biogenesis system outer membrane secretion channel CsgG
MNGKLVAGLAAVVALVGLSGTAAAQSKSKKIQVAVMDFDFGSIDHWWGQADIGKGMADQVMDALINADGSPFRVIERKKLDTILAEQDFAHSNRADPGAAKLSKLGKVLGVRYVITGSITKFSTEKRGGSISVGGIGSFGGSKAKSEVHLTARLVDTTTGEVLLSAKGKGESGKGGGFDASKGGIGVGTHSEEWRESGLGEAQERACDKLVEEFIKKKDRIE